MSLKSHIPVAIVGMGCLFPKSNGMKAFIRLLFGGLDGISEVPGTHWSSTDYFDEDPDRPDHVYCKRGGFLPSVSFDPAEFGIPPSSLEATDTSQLLGLLVARQALEDAGYGKNRPFDRQKTSVILGATGTQELVIPLGARLGFPRWRKALAESGIPPETADEVVRKISDTYVSWQESSFPGLLGNVIAGRICNRLDLGGTNCVVDAACASSLGAIHMALLELAAGRSDMVITGGVDALNDIFMHMCFAKTRILSRTGDVRPFSADADGTVLGEGIGLLVMKRLDDARRDRDRIYAVIRGMGTASDGKSQSIYSPHPEGQARALQAAYEAAGFDPGTVELIETHGTGTRVGDAVEFEALKQVFGKAAGEGKRNWCALGSVKSMIGHTKAAAGSAGLIKTALSLYHKVIPPTLKIERPDPALGVPDSPFYLSTEGRPWLGRKGHRRRAGVSAFGFGGSNFHVVLEEYGPEKPEICWDGSVEIAAFSASSRKGLVEKLKDAAELFGPGISPAAFSHGTRQTRSGFDVTDPFRLLFILNSDPACNGFPDFTPTHRQAVERISNGIEDSCQERDWFFGTLQAPGKTAFLFPGQGSQYVGMGKDLVRVFPEAFGIFQQADERIGGLPSLGDAVYPHPALSQEEKKHQEENLRGTEIAQPAIGAVSLAMYRILEEFGLRPDAACGHSFGELTALCASGWMEKEAFYDLAASRGRCMAASAGGSDPEGGAMLAVQAPLDELASLLAGTGSAAVLANRNSPGQGVLSGSAESVAQMEAECRLRGFSFKRLPVSAAFHSPAMENARRPFRQILDSISFSPTRVPVFSNVTGKPYPLDSGGICDLLAEQLVRPVEFVRQIENLYAMGVRTFLEVGPKPVLTGLVNGILKKRPFHALAMDPSAGRQSGTADLARFLCRLACLGYPVDLSRWEQSASEPPRQRMSIPLCGANSRSTLSQKKAPAAKALPNRAPERVTESHSHPDDGNTMKNIPTSNISTDLLQVVQEGLKSMQALQTQTALAHQKFLETQAQAGRTLQSTMEQMRRMAEAALGIRPGPAPEYEAFRDQAPPRASRPLSPPAPPVPGPVLQAHEKPVSHEEKAVLPQAENRLQWIQPEAEAPPAKDPRLLETLLAVVSRLTGYPAEMLGLDMDIEADLGIDSIKRVEILSAMEERIPGLPAVSPDIMGRLKTLGQIIEHLAGPAPEAIPASRRTGACPPAGTISAPGEEGSAGSFQDLTGILLEVVSRLTGYPAEMLGLDMDIEADLGIDSIKRVEILSAMEERIPSLPGVSPDIMGRLKTLGQIVDHLSGSPKKPDPRPREAQVQYPPSQKPSTHGSTDVSYPIDIERKIVSLPVRPSSSGATPATMKGCVLVTENGDGLSRAIVEELRSRGVEARSVSLENIPDRLPPAAGVVIVAEDYRSANGDGEDLWGKFLKNAFLLARRTGPDLMAASGKGKAFFSVVTRMDGGFGFKGRDIPNPLQGGLCALAKTASLEWEGVLCRALDIDPQWQDPAREARAAVHELLHPVFRDGVEIGLSREARVVPELIASPFSHTGEPRLDLSPEDVVVVSGGARGVTAAAAAALAGLVRPTLVLLGRSPLPREEPAWRSGLTEEPEIKKAIMEHEFNAKAATPAEVEKRYRACMAGREISAGLERIKKTGANGVYCSVDIRDLAGLTRVMDEIRSAYGPIRGLIHGAGVLSDRLIVDKTPEQFQSVFETKVKGLRNLLVSMEGDPLRYLVLFSSVAARMGNRGQADYAMANEVLNKVASNEARNRPGCKVVSINWGPWEGGMVGPSLKREFARRNIRLIPVEQGPLCMLHEMAAQVEGPVEVVIGATLGPNGKPAPSPPQDRPSPKTDLSVSLRREFSAEEIPVLESHILDGKPVIPFALMAEWLGHGALHGNPGLFFQGLDDVRILKGIRMDTERKMIRLLTGRPQKTDAVYEVAVEIRDGVENGNEVIHSRAKVILADSPPAAPGENIPVIPRSGKGFRSVAEIYETILFHGEHLRGIKEILAMTDLLMAARIATAPSPSQWMKKPLRSRWITDPLVLDSAFQMAIVWCHEQTGMVCLPGFMASYRQYRDFPPDEVVAVLEVTESTGHKMKGDFTFLSPDNAVVARITGYEATLSPTLMKAFGNPSVADARMSS